MNANALVFKGDARLDDLSPVELQGRWSADAVKAELSVQDLPLQTLDPDLGGEFAGSLTVEGKPNQPKLSARFSLLQPSVAGLQAPELWQGRWQPGSLRLSSASTQVVARLKDNRLQSLQAVKGDGSISVVPSGAGYRWAARQWALAPLHLGLRGNRPLPLNGVLEGNGRLGLNPLLLQGQASVSDPALAWIKGRQLQLSGVLRYPGFDVSAEVLPQGSGSVQLTSRGAWNGPSICKPKRANCSPVGSCGCFKTCGVQRPNAPMGAPVIWAALPSTPSAPAWMPRSRRCSKPKRVLPLSAQLRAMTAAFLWPMLKV